jgi:hypothetical protein
MRFEERVTGLCAQALAASDETEVRKILTELRFMLHQHIEQLRGSLLVAYTESKIRLKSSEPIQRRSGTRVEIMGPEGSAKSQSIGNHVPRTWQQVVHEIAREKDHDRVLHLSQELSRFLQQS